MFADLAGYLIAFFFSFSFAGAYYGLFRAIGKVPRITETVIGVVPVSIAAIVLESYLFNPVGIVLGLLIVAPVLEEFLKFVGTVRKRDLGSGLGVGIGFAFTENLLYFHSFLTGSHITGILSFSFVSSQIFLFIIMRGAFDPLLHSSLSGLSTRSWQKGRRFWLPTAVGFHVAYNLVAITGMTDIPFLAVADAMVLGPALFLLLWKPKRFTEIPWTESPVAQKEQPPKPRPTNHHVDIDKLGIDNLAAWIRSSSRTIGFEGIAKEIGLELPERYERTMWIRRSLTVSNGRKLVYTETGPYGVLLIAGMIALASFSVWVLFG